MTCDRQKTGNRTRKLEHYLSSNVLVGRNFKCEHFKECKASHCGKGKFYAGQLHHVGKFYDLRLNGQALRVVVVGQENGRAPNGGVRSRYDLKKRYDAIMRDGLRRSFKKEPDYEGYRNPHMRGTTSVLRLLFDIGLGADHDKEFLTIHGKRVHIFDAFALVNYLLCSAVGRDDPMRGKATKVMKKNCLGHFQKVMSILEPTVVVVEGKGFWDSIKRAFDSDSVKRVRNHVYRARLGTSEMLVAVFTHPAAHGGYNWGNNDHTPYLLKTVKPSIKWIRQRING